MSAYALPGLFPPIDTTSQSCSSDAKSTTHSSKTDKKSSLSQGKLPLHLEDQDGNYSGKRYNSKIGISSKDDDEASSSSSNIGCILNTAAIVVNEAKIDPVRWIQHITGSNPQKYAHQIGKTLRRRVSNSNSGSSSGTRNTGQLNRVLSDTNKSSSDSRKNQPNEAIEFELSITLNGRKYTAKRTMQCILQLRDDLIRETRRRRQWLVEKEDLQTSSRLQLRQDRSQVDNNDGHFRFTQISYLDASHSSSATRRTLQTSDENEDMHSNTIQIPEVPPFTGGHDRGDMNGHTGFVGKGFTMLHAMMKSYVPVMESWLKNVMEIVPQDSECLMNFLWEPASEISYACFKSVLDSANEGDQMCTSSKTLKSSTSLATLGSIKELEHNTDDESSESEYSESGW